MRPVALPDDIDDPRIEKASGAVELPLHVYWSGGPRTWNLDNRRQRVHLYQIVMREGTDEDVSAFIDLDELIRLWNDLYLPEYVREAWIAFVRAKRSIDLPGRSGPGTPVPPSP